MGYNDDCAAIVMSKTFQDLHDVLGVGGVKISRRFIGKDDFAALCILLLSQSFVII